LHFGHIRLLVRAIALGDYLFVAVIADDIDIKRGKINVKQSLTERINSVAATGLADMIIVEEYEGQKIDDIQKYDVDIFTVGSDWVGQFDYLNKYCQVVYLPRTEGVSSSELRAESNQLKIGIVGDSPVVNKFRNECKYVNGVESIGIFTNSQKIRQNFIEEGLNVFDSYNELLEKSDAVYIVSHPNLHYTQIKQALLNNKHVLCESPIASSVKELEELYKLADKRDLILMDATKTAYATAYHRMLLLANSGKIGHIVSVDSTCTSLSEMQLLGKQGLSQRWNSICAWGPTALLPIFQLLGTDYKKKHITSLFEDADCNYDSFTKIDFVYESATASLKVGKGVKSEGELVISGTKGYIYVPAPWWKTNYFEIRYENPENNERFFFQLDGEGIRYAIANFGKMINTEKKVYYIDRSISKATSAIIEDFNNMVDVTCLKLDS